MTKKEGIKKVYGDNRHVVILGAGASIASTDKNPEKSGKRLPSMDNFIELLGLEDIISRIKIQVNSNNFEEIYNSLYLNNPCSDEIICIENKVYNYFKDMSLPEEPTIIYDSMSFS